MKKNRTSYFKTSPFKIVTALFMAVIMFFLVPVRSHAALSANGDITLNVNFRSPTLRLDFFGNYINPDDEGGGSRDTAIPYVYKGSSYVTYEVAAKPGSDGVMRPYLNGYAYKKVTMSLTSQIPGASYTGAPEVSVSFADSSNEDIAVYVQGVSGNENSFSFYLVFAFKNADCERYSRGGCTIDYTISLYSVAHNFGSAYGYINYSASLATDYSGSVTYGQYITDGDRGASQFYNMLNAQNNNLADVKTKLDTNNTQLGNINTNITNRASEIKTKQDTTNSRLSTINTNITTQSNNIQKKIQAQIDNDNANHKAIMANWDAWEIITGDREDYHLENDNKNADDIMHSFDSGSQEDKNSEFDSSQKQLQETEDNLFGSASDYFSGLDFSLFDIAKFTSVVSSLSFVSSLMQSLFVKMGDFGLIVMVGMVILIASKVTGVYRFSTGDHGKGG